MPSSSQLLVISQVVTGGDPQGGNQGGEIIFCFKHFRWGFWQLQSYKTMLRRCWVSTIFQRPKLWKKLGDRGDSASSRCPVHFLFSLLLYPKNPLFWKIFILNPFHASDKQTLEWGWSKVSAINGKKPTNTKPKLKRKITEWKKIIATSMRKGKYQYWIRAFLIV